jgi:hypothetical protein
MESSEAFNEEIDHLFDLQCFESTKDLPKGKKKPSGYKFVFKIKPDKFKVRLTSKGFQQNTVPSSQTPLHRLSSYLLPDEEAIAENSQHSGI